MRRLVQFIEPNSFALGLSLNLLLMVIVGGSGYFFGPFVGTLIPASVARMAARHGRGTTSLCTRPASGDDGSSVQRVCSGSSSGRQVMIDGRHKATRTTTLTEGAGT